MQRSGLLIGLQLECAKVSLEAGNRRIPPATPQVIAAIISINCTDFCNFLGEHGPPDPRRESCLAAAFLPQPPTSRNQLLTIKLIETPECVPLVCENIIILSFNLFFSITVPH